MWNKQLKKLVGKTTGERLRL